ncbi:hypothetical protein J3R83DRAFT_6597 [Lanmaoa asiatica]|nr:hypothetical protein J3R83DRAFT_6597 [Lanmaoa asiatica]
MRSFHLLSLVSSVFLFLCIPSQAQHAYGHEKPRVRHRHTNNLSSTFDVKYKRDANAAFTYFNDGQGACGITNGPNDFVRVVGEFDGGAHCFEMITITINGKTAQAQITDQCPGCSVGGLDFSQGLFEYFAPLSEGEIYGSWSYKSDVTTSMTPPTPTTSYTSTSTPPTTVATTTTLSSTSSSITITTSLASTVIPATSTVPTSTPQDPQVITQINLALLELGSLLQASFKL